MATKLKDDQIRWVLDLEATGVQAELQKITASTYQLEKANKTLSDSLKRRQKELAANERELRKLEKAGQTMGIKYKELKALTEAQRESIARTTQTIQNNTKAIQTNTRQHDKLIETMKIEDMTMAQLQQRASSLSWQLENTSQSSSPETYAKLQKELSQVTGRMGELNNAGKQVSKTGATLRGGMSVFLGNVATKFIGFLVNAAQRMKEFVWESTKVAQESEGIIRAFERLNQPDLLSNLRQATRGTVSDLQLMKSAVRADNFNIPLESFGNMLKFAQQRAIDTGESVDYLVNSIVDGIGRKSSLVLDNLGISAARLQNEVKKTGDFSQAAIKIINEELEKQGELALTGADRAQQSAVKWENAQLKVGRRFQWIRNIWNSLSGDMADTVSDLMGDMKSANQVYDDQISKVAGLEANTVPLLIRYDELASKTKLNATEQAELNSIIKQISLSIPGAVSKFDEYGNAIELNTDKAYAFIEAEKARLKFLNGDAIQETEKNIKDIEQQMLELQTKHSLGGKQVYSGGGVGSPGSYSFYKYTEEEMKGFLKQITDLGNNLKLEQDKLNILTGKSLEEQLEAQKATIEQRKAFNEMNKAELDKWINDEKNADSEYMKLAKDIYQFRFGTVDDPAVTERQQKSIDNLMKNTEALLKVEERAYTERLKKANLYEVDVTKLTQEQLDKRAELEEDHFKRIEEISKEAENARYRSEKKNMGLDGDPRKMTDDQKKALEILEAQHQDNLERIEEEGEKRRLDSARSFDQAFLNAYAQARDSLLKAQEANYKAEQLALLASLRDKKISQELYEQELRELEQKNLDERIAIRESYADMVSGMERDVTQEQIEALNENNEQLTDLMNQAESQRLNNDIDFEERRKAIQQQYGLLSIADQQKMEMEALQELYDQELISEEEFQQAKLAIKLKYAQQYVGQAQQLISAASDAVTALQNAETAGVQAEYEKQHTALKKNLDAGIISQEQYNQQKEKLEYEQKEKELEVQKKFADAQFALKVAEIGAATAVGIMNAWASSMTLGPIAGPIMAGIMTAILGVTAAAQIAAAKKERDRVKNTTLEASSSGSASTASIQLNSSPGFAGSTSADQYEYAGNASANTGSYAGDYVVEQPELKEPALLSHSRGIERAARRGARTPADDDIAGTAASLENAAAQFNEAVDKFAVTRVRGDWNISEFHEADSQYNDSMNLGNRRNK